MSEFTPIPTRWVGEMQLTGEVNEALSVPLATYESPLWPSVARGARLSRHCPDGIRVTVLDSRMTRSIILESEHAAAAFEALQSIQARFADWQTCVQQSSRYARLLDIHGEIVGKLLFLRFAFFTGDAAGHNMATKAAESIMDAILNAYPQLRYGSISGNLCCDKKTSAVNGLLGRGHHVIAEILIPEALCQKFLRTDAARLCALNQHKNYVGGVLAGSLRSANAHFANMLLAFYLATGQDAANIVEGSQGMVHTENRNGALYFACSLPNLIVGTVGNGKHLAQIEAHLQRLGCREARPAGENAKRLAAICAATVLCGELSLLAAQCNRGELMRSHLVMERAQG